MDMAEYQAAEFDDEDGNRWPLADEVLAHLMRMAIAEQEEIEKQTGKKATVPRKRPAWKASRNSARQGNTGRS